MKKSLFTGLLACLMIIQPAPAKAGGYGSALTTLVTIYGLGAAQAAGLTYLAGRAVSVGPRNIGKLEYAGALSPLITLVGWAIKEEAEFKYTKWREQKAKQK